MNLMNPTLPGWIDTLTEWGVTDDALLCSSDWRLAPTLHPDAAHHITPEHFTLVSSRIDAGRTQIYAVARAEIDAIHPELWAALCLITECQKRADNGGKAVTDELNNRLFTAQAMFLLNPLVVEDSRGFERHVARVHEIHWNATTRVLRCDAQVYAVTDCLQETDFQAAEEVTPFVYGTCMNPVFPTEAWLNEHVPGWEDRVNAGLALGYSEKELVDVVFSTTSTPCTDTPLPTLDIT